MKVKILLGAVALAALVLAGMAAVHLGEPAPIAPTFEPPGPVAVPATTLAAAGDGALVTMRASGPALSARFVATADWELTWSYRGPGGSYFRVELVTEASGAPEILRTVGSTGAAGTMPGSERGILRVRVVEAHGPYALAIEQVGGQG